MKKIAIITAVLMFTIQAFALQPYLGANIGGARTDTKIEGSNFTDYVPNLGVSAGLKLTKAFRTEIQYAYTFKAEDTILDEKADFALNSLMFNVLFDLDNTAKTYPILGVGIGNTWISHADRNGNLTLAAYFGVSNKLNDNLDLDILGKYVSISAEWDKITNIGLDLVLRFSFL